MMMMSKMNTNWDKGVDGELYFVQYISELNPKWCLSVLNCRVAVGVRGADNLTEFVKNYPLEHLIVMREINRETLSTVYEIWIIYLSAHFIRSPPHS